MSKYKSARAFKNGLEAKLKNEFGGDFSLDRQRVVFNRFLVRLSLHFEDRVVLKGGLAIEQRISKARTTIDVDLTLKTASKDVLTALKKAGAAEYNDFMRFEVSVHKQATIKNEGLNYEGKRFRVECFLDGKTYGNPFSLDIVFEHIFGRVERVALPHVLDFAEIRTSDMLVYPLETHIAEKLHAYSMPIEKKNSRIKDLPDLALLASRPISSRILRDAFEYVFDKRNTHPLPAIFPSPPSFWEDGYPKMAEANGFDWVELDDLYEVVSRFINPVLGSFNEDLLWDSKQWEWR